MKVVAVIGLGHIAIRHRRNLRKLFPSSKIIAMSSSGRAVGEVVSDSDQVVSGTDELISYQPELVIVASPAPMHAKHAVPLIEKNIPVIIEKPLSDTNEGAEKILELLKTNGKSVAVGYCLRFLPSAMVVKRLLDAQTLGVPLNATAEVGQYLPDWRPGTDYRNGVSAKKSLGGGVLLELSHELDYLQWLFGSLDIEYAALRQAPGLDIEVEAIADIVASNIDKTIVNIHLDFVQRPPKRKCSIVFSEGRIDWDLLKNEVVVSDVNGVNVVYSDPQWDKNFMYMDMIRDFLDGNSAESRYCNLADAAKTVSIVSKIKSICKNERVNTQ